MTGNCQDFQIHNEKVVSTTKLIGINQLLNILHYNEDSSVYSTYCKILIKSMSDI